MEIAAQPSLFDRPPSSIPAESVLLYALGEFQSRGHVLADRELALDRLHRALVRAAEKFAIPPLSDAATAGGLRDLGAKVVDIPAYFAKRPYRVTVPPALASRALTVYHQINGKHS